MKGNAVEVYLLAYIQVINEREPTALTWIPNVGKYWGGRVNTMADRGLKKISKIEDYTARG